MEKTDSIQQPFFALLRAGLWGTPADAALFGPDTDWNELYRLAKGQTVAGILLDGIQTLPAECRPPRGLYLQWCNTLMVIEEKNHLLNRELANVLAVAAEADVRPLLVKGQGVAQSYRNPLHRQPGDIDLFTGDEGFERLNECLRREATFEEEETYKHTTLTWHSITVENHRVLATLSSPQANRRLQQCIRQWHSDPSLWRTVEVEGCPVKMPPLEFDVVYVLMHAALHFLNEGIGMRHVCDWMCLLHTYSAVLDKKRVAELFQLFGLTRAARLMGAIAVEHLGLPAEDLPIAYTPADLPDARWLLSTIVNEGNFGRYGGQRKKRPAGYWRGKWYTWTRIMARCREMGRLSPTEARWYPISVALHSMQVQWKKRVK